MRPKTVVVIGDGMADFRLDELGGRTPLEAARKPAMDNLARRGVMGLAWNVPAHLPAGSDVAIMSIMGYDPEKNFTGRGPLEAASMGISVAPDETVFRCNVINTDGPTLIDYSAGHISSDEAAELIDALNEKLGRGGLRFHPGIMYRHIMVVRGDFARVQTFAPHDHMNDPWEEFTPAGEGAAALVELIRESEAVLDAHPVNHRRRAAGKRTANRIWPWGGGAMPQFEKYHARFGLTGNVISAVDLVDGIGVLAGLPPIKVEGATGLVDTNYEGKLRAALGALEERDFACVHIEGCDEAAHDGNLKLKIMGIERIDERIVAPLVEGLEKFDDYTILITPDHATPIPLRTHNHDPVPFIIYRKGGAAAPSGRVYSEREAAATGVEFRRGCELMPALLKM